MSLTVRGNRAMAAIRPVGDDDDDNPQVAFARVVCQELFQSRAQIEEVKEDQRQLLLNQSELWRRVLDLDPATLIAACNAASGTGINALFDACKDKFGQHTRSLENVTEAQHRMSQWSGELVDKISAFWSDSSNAVANLSRGQDDHVRKLDEASARLTGLELQGDELRANQAAIKDAQVHLSKVVEENNRSLVAGATKYVDDAREALRNELQEQLQVQLSNVKSYKRKVESLTREIEAFKQQMATSENADAMQGLRGVVEDLQRERADNEASTAEAEAAIRHLQAEFDNKLASKISRESVMRIVEDARENGMAGGGDGDLVKVVEGAVQEAMIGRDRRITSLELNVSQMRADLSAVLLAINRLTSLNDVRPSPAPRCISEPARESYGHPPTFQGYDAAPVSNLQNDARPSLRERSMPSYRARTTNSTAVYSNGIRSRRSMHSPQEADELDTKLAAELDSYLGIEKTQVRLNLVASAKNEKWVYTRSLSVLVFGHLSKSVADMPYPYAFPLDAAKGSTRLFSLVEKVAALYGTFVNGGEAAFDDELNRIKLRIALHRGQMHEEFREYVTNAHPQHVAELSVAVFGTSVKPSEAQADLRLLHRAAMLGDKSTWEAFAASANDGVVQIRGITYNFTPFVVEPYLNL